MITSTANRRVRWVRSLQSSRRVRKREKIFILEGSRLAYEAVAAQQPIRLVLHSDHLDERGRGLINSMQRLGAEVLSVSDAVMAACSDTQTPQGILAVLPIPDLPLPEKLSLVLIVDRVADPGNLGTILRTALATDVEAVLLTEGTVDVYNPKVVRSAMGAHFHLPLIETMATAITERHPDLEMWSAVADSGTPYFDVDWRKPVALIVGSEAQGIQPALEARSTSRVQIPTSTKTESLNAAIAAAVILFEISRQRGER